MTDTRMSLDNDVADRGPTARSASAIHHEVNPNQAKATVDPLDHENTPAPVDETSRPPVSPSNRPPIWVTRSHIEPDDDRSVQSDSFSRQAEVNPSYSMTVVHSRRNANGTVGSVYSGNKVKHLKKEDGIPLWRKDIQYAFLRAVFEDETRAFTLEGDGSKNHSFAEIYIHAMARSSKTSKVLREKLLSDREAATNMAMICLLVNVGRMNTTLNFFPEMRAQLRTYHSIPCLQVHQDQNSQYKGLQDAPRLKSILKGSCEDAEQPNSLEKIQAAPVPRTNPVNLIFVLSQYAPKVTEDHIAPPRDFFDLIIRPTLSSRSRARAFLWLCWWYLEGDFTREAALSNPFGAGLPRPDDPSGIPTIVPDFEHLQEQEANDENIDTEEEKVYGERMRLARKRILEDDETVGPPLKKPAGPSPARSEVDRTRSPSPTTGPPINAPKPRRPAPNGRSSTAAAADSDAVEPQADRPPAGRIILKSHRLERHPASSPPVPPGAGHAVLNAATPHARRARPETSHQRAVNHNRRLRVDRLLHRQLRAAQREARRRLKARARPAYRALARVWDLRDDYDTEDEGVSWGPGGLVPNPAEDSDWGGEALRHRKVLARGERRLAREHRAAELGRPVRPRAAADGASTGRDGGDVGRKRRRPDELDGAVNGRGTKRARSSEAPPAPPSDEESDSDDLGDLTEDEMPDELSMVV